MIPEFILNLVDKIPPPRPARRENVDLLMDKISWLAENTLSRAVGYIKSGHRISLWQGKGKSNGI